MSDGFHVGLQVWLAAGISVARLGGFDCFEQLNLVCCELRSIQVKQFYLAAVLQAREHGLPPVPYGAESVCYQMGCGVFFRS